MKKLSITLFVFSSFLVFSQVWENSYPDNTFKNTYRTAYENTYNHSDDEQQLYKKKETEIALEAGYVKTALNGVKNIFENTQNDNSVDRQANGSAISVPGAPGEPVPIDDNILILFFTALSVMIFRHKNIKHNTDA